MLLFCKVSGVNFTKVLLALLLSLCALDYRALAQISDLTQETLAPGVIHHQFVHRVGRGDVSVHVLEIDQSRGYSIKPALALGGSIWGKSTLTEIVSRNRALAGLNANYFRKDGLPIGSLAIDREWIISPILHRATLSLDENGKAYFARPVVYGKLETGNARELVRVSCINQPDSLSEEGNCFYNHWWQQKVSCGEGKSCLLVDGKGLVRLKVEASESITPLQPTRSDYVLSLASRSADLSSLQVGSKVNIRWFSAPDWSRMTHAIGGGPYLVSKGNIILDESAEGFTASSGIGGSAPRTAVGITAPGRLIWLTADGRQENSVGLSLRELAQLLKEIGVTEAINLDGGGSTTMVYGNQVINSPSDKGGLRPISTALLLYSQAQSRQAKPRAGP